MGSRNWRNACSLIIASGSNQATGTFNYNLMMLKRSLKSSFMPAAFVYPGGVCEKTDFSSSWLDVFLRHGAKPENLARDFVSHRKGPAPLMYGDISVPNLLPEIGFRISAIRETFEETGILFCKTLSSDEAFVKDISTELAEWREKIAKDASQFEVLCKLHHLCPNVWSLYEWSNWLTPVDVGPKRFDTMFYICVLDEQPTILVDNKEITNSVWIDPVSAVKSHLKKEIWLAPPQLYETCRLARFTEIRELGEFARNRQNLGTDRWLPVRYNTQDGAISVLPGDSLYPESLNLVEVKTESLENETIESSRHNSHKLHRLEGLSPVDFHIKCNIQVPCGHLQPLDLIEILDKQISQKDPAKL